jgi:hypothetical protein
MKTHRITASALREEQSGRLNNSTIAVARGILTAAVALTLWVGAPRALGQVPVDSGFEETNPNYVQPIANIVYPLTAGSWGVENAYVTGPTYTSPYEGTQMLEMLNDGLTYTEAWQFLDVGPGSGRTANLSAWFNAFQPNAIGFVDLIFYATSNDWGNPISDSQTIVTLTLGNNNNAWEQISLNNVAVPNGTTWVGVHLGFNDASIGTERGDVDAVQFSIVPEPSTWALLASGFGALSFFMRRRSGTAD